MRLWNLREINKKGAIMNVFDFNINFEINALKKEIDVLQKYLAMEKISVEQKAETIRATGEVVRDILIRLKSYRLIEKELERFELTDLNTDTP